MFHCAYVSEHHPGSLDNFPIGFWIIADNNLCGKHKFMKLSVLFSEIIFTDENHIYDFWSLNSIVKTLDYEWTSLRVWRNDI